MALSRNNARLRSRAFLPHAAIQVSVLLLTCVGLALGLLLPVTGRTPHKCVGYLTLALAAFPLTAALWRPAPGGAARRLWAGCHRACGLAAVAAAFVDGYLGVRRTGMQPRCVPAAIMVRCDYVSSSFAFAMMCTLLLLLLLFLFLSLLFLLFFSFSFASF
jgi:hypothetical protein